MGGIRILDTTPDSIYLQALVNITNPTPYSAHIPYISVHVLCNDSLIGEVTAEDLDVSRGNNTNLVVTMKWDPSLGGTQGKEIGRNMMSQYISGFNTSLTVRTHRDSIPSQPLIGEALSKLNITVATPRLKVPDEGDGNGDSKGHFIRDATFHVVSSTASFTLVSPLEHNTVYIDHINATAFYNHTEAVGKIIYNYPIAASPGASQTPKLPVQWSIGSNGYEKLKQALGGELKLDASAIVSVRIGSWRETVWYVGKGIGAAIRL